MVAFNRLGVPIIFPARKGQQEEKEHFCVSSFLLYHKNCIGFYGFSSGFPVQGMATRLELGGCWRWCHQCVTVTVPVALEQR